MKSNLIACVVAFIVGGATIGLLVREYAEPPSPIGEWKPTGDGKTVVHSLTGELRIASSGRSVREVREENAQRDAIEDERRAREAAAAAKRYGELMATRWGIYNRLKEAAMAHATEWKFGPYEQTGWNDAVTAFRGSVMLDYHQTKALVDSLNGVELPYQPWAKHPDVERLKNDAAKLLATMPGTLNGRLSEDYLRQLASEHRN